VKILAIRGCNLASLAGEFEIDLARAPIGGAGVFAIVGNTGAGKSTLLDALCVALFDRTPRLTNHSTVKVGRGDERALLGAQDVRTLLRRGAAQGWAEVDFESGDAKQYRARWSVRRARGQSDGTLQDEQISLTAIDGGERFGGTKTETLKAIHARLGLSFDQFRRSALLAQGEFAAFLRADGKDRSELLERMTGTQIYSQLSIAAHVKAAAAEQRVREGRTAALAIAVLDEAAAQAVRGELERATAAALTARRRHAAAVEAARWLAEADKRSVALAEAGAAHAAAGAASAAAAAERAELALLRRAELLRPAWDDAARLERGAGVAADELAAAAQAAARAASDLAAIAQRRARIAELQAPVRAARIAAGIVERGAGVLAADRAVRGAPDDAAWLVARAALAPEIAAWPELAARFAQHGSVGEAILALDRALAEHAESKVKLEREHARIAGEARAAAHKHEEAKRKAAGYSQKRGLTLEAARRQEDQARTRLGEVERLAAVAAGARAAAATGAQIDEELGRLAAATAADAARAAALGEAQRARQLLRAEQARGVEELRRAAGYEHARAELASGEPCPLCGATEHPWRDRGALDDVIAAAAARLDATRTELEAIASEAAAITARDHQHALGHARLVAQRAAAIAAAAAAATAWRDQLGALGELLLAGDPATPEAEALAADRHAAARKALDDARTMRSQTEAATKAAQDAQAEVQMCQLAVEELGRQRGELERRRGELEASVGRIRGERASKLEHHAALAGELVAAMARWSAALPGEPAGAAAATAPQGGGGIDPALALGLVGRLQASAPLGATREPVPSAPLAIVQLAMAAVAAAWRDRADRIAEADAALSAATATVEREARDAERAVAEHTTRHRDAERRRAELARDHAVAVARLTEALGAAGFAAAELGRLLSSPPSRGDALAERLAGLERAVDRTRAVVTERERQLAEHAAARPGGEGPAEPAEPSGAAAAPGAHRGLPAQLAADAANVPGLAAAVDAANELAHQLKAALEADASARARQASALARVTADETSAEIDRILGDVIGSHDGKLFRSFAQSLTLDGLLAVANAHLEELAPRYQLERVPRHDLELQVIDRDLGSEIRSVQSLSGGESFLVSLALALGLSSMSAHDVRVRTLLIDEGFGTLDPATLDSALSVLDALQATGRQVGVISHVPALVERVGAHVRVVQRGGGRSEVIVA